MPKSCLTDFLCSPLLNIKYIPTTTYLGTIFWSTASIFVRPYFLLTCWENGQGLLQMKSAYKAFPIWVSDWNVYVIWFWWITLFQRQIRHFVFKGSILIFISDKDLILKSPNAPFQCQFSHRTLRRQSRHHPLKIETALSRCLNCKKSLSLSGQIYQKPRRPKRTTDIFFLFLTCCLRANVDLMTDWIFDRNYEK